MNKIIFGIILLAIIATSSFIVYYLKKHKYITDKQLDILIIVCGIVATVAFTILYFTERLPKALASQSILELIVTPILIISFTIITISAIKRLKK